MEGKNVFRAELLQPLGCQLGEGPMWHAERQTCFWVDIQRNTFFEYNAGNKKTRSWPVDGPVSVVLPGTGDEVFLGMHNGIRRFNLDSGEELLVTDLGRNWEHHRCNDGKCDRHGRLWIGTTDMDHREGAGALYCVPKEGTVEKKLDAVTISNGMAWSPDNKWFYHTDTPSREIRAYHYDPESAAISFHEVVIRIPENLGFPDGMTIDKDGMLWIALWGGFGVGQWDPNTGEMIGFIEVPVPLVSSCAFVGRELNDLVITTARHTLSPEDLIAHPGSGDTFIASPGTRGLPEVRCAL